MTDTPETPWRLALRRGQALDDVVVNDVSMFRAEMLSPTQLWLACYLPETGEEGDRITFEVTVGEDGNLVFDVVENPSGGVVEES